MARNPLFLYGSLRREFIPRNEHARLAWRGATELGEARVAGRLYLVQDYPGLVGPAADGDWVYGQLVIPPQFDIIWSLLDEYEGPEYERVLLPAALLSDGSNHEAWVYRYKGEYHETWRIPSGRFILPA